MKINTLRFVLALSLLLNISLLATAGYRYYAQSSAKSGPFGMDATNGRFPFEELSLSADQAEFIHAKAMSFHVELDRMRLEIAAMRKQLISRMRQDDSDNREIDAAITSISRKQEEMQKTATSHMLEMKNLLDKQQQKEFFDLIERAMAEERPPAACPPAECQ
jgi:Spy/CpxP family protein refolding chaperone